MLLAHVDNAIQYGEDNDVKVRDDKYGDIDEEIDNGFEL